MARLLARPFGLGASTGRTVNRLTEYSQFGVSTIPSVNQTELINQH